MAPKGSTTIQIPESLRQQIAELHQQGFTPKVDREQGTTLVSVPLQRLGSDASMFKLAFVVGDTFPTIAPELHVFETGQKLDRDGQLLDDLVLVDSQALQAWEPESRLLTVVEEIRQKLNCRSPERLAPRRTFNSGPPWATVALAAFALAGLLGAGFFYWQSRDPCAEDYARARALIASDLPQALEIYEELYIRGERGERGSCATLYNDPAAMREGYIDRGQLLFREGQISDATAAYLRAAELGSPLADERLDEVQRQLWTQANTLGDPTGQEGWVQLLTIFSQIKAIDPAAKDPNDLPLAVREAKAQVGLGNLLYAERDLKGAKDAYDSAAATLGALSEEEQDLEQVQLLQRRLEAGSEWIVRSGAIEAMTVDSAPQLLAELEQLDGKTKDAVDPAGESITDWRCHTITVYGELLNGPSEEAAAAAREQALAALELCADNPEALALRSAAEKTLTGLSSFRFQLNDKPDPDELNAILSRAGLNDTAAREAINLIVFRERPLIDSIPVVQQSSSRTEVTPTFDNGPAQGWSLEPGEYQVLIRGSENDYNTQRILIPSTDSGDQRFLVRVLSNTNPREQP